MEPHTTIHTQEYKRQLQVISAGFLNFLPGICYTQHEAMYKEILKTRMLSYREQDLPDAVSSLKIQNSRRLNEIRLAERPVIFCTYHLGSYRLLNAKLAEQGIPFSLVTGDTVCAKQAGIFRSLFRKYNRAGQEEELSVINGESPSAGFQLLRELKKGKSLVIYIDGNSGAGRETINNQNALDVSFLSQEIKARSGIGYLSYAASVPVYPVISYRDSNENNHLVFGDPLIADKTGRKEDAVPALIRSLYDFAAPYINDNPGQWESWLYIHKVAKIVNPCRIRLSGSKTAASRLKFNQLHFGLFTIKGKPFILNKTNYISHNISTELYHFLECNEFAAESGSECSNFNISELINYGILTAA